MKLQYSLLTLLFFSQLFPLCSSSSIVFTTLGRSKYAFDIFTLPLSPSDPPASSVAADDELKITDGESVNFNGFFPSNSSALLSLLPPPLPAHALVYVSERNATSNVYLDAYDHLHHRHHISNRLQIPLLRPSPAPLSMKDKPSVSGHHLIYVSTHQSSRRPRRSWAAVYSTNILSGRTRRLTPPGVADFSPAVSPSGEWTAVSSYGPRGWGGEVQDLRSDLYIFRTRDGSDRVKVADHGGWPSWADESSLYFHRQSPDGWWSVYRASLPDLRSGRRSAVTDSVGVIKRVTPPGFHAFTPAAPAGGGDKFIALATRRPSSRFRHIELLDLERNVFVEITKRVSPDSHHYNPFLSPDSARIGYHRCRGDQENSLMLDHLTSPLPEISLFRIDGSFPSFSPDGDRIAFVGLPGLYVVNSDGSGKLKVLSSNAFATAWDWKRKGVIYTSLGPDFASEITNVDVIAIDLEQPVSDQPLSPYFFKKLTTGGENNAFPSPSPDGKWVAFRSGRSGYKNLYIMDAVEGEKGGIRRLTEGPWTDTMCNWSPDGEWIAFCSDRDNPGSGSFAIYLVRPDGTGLHKAVHSGDGGRTNHPWFSPDSKQLVFTSDYAGVSAEPIANPHHYQPYGDIFVANLDGTGIVRMTYNSYEDGTPAWSPKIVRQVGAPGGSFCAFEDCHWLALEQGNLVSSLNRTCAVM